MSNGLILAEEDAEVCDRNGATFHLHAHEGEEQAVEEALREVRAATRQEPGCLSFHLFQSMRDARLFFIHSRWVDEAAFQKHAELPHTLKFLKKVDALVDQPREVSRTRMIA